jgi:probable rRNA maturation factor
MSTAAIPEVDLTLQAGQWQDDEHYAALCRKVIEAACQLAGLRVRTGSEVGVVLTDDDHIRRLNAEHRGKNAPTNVLSFPICDAEVAVKGPLLGDIVVAFETLSSEAAERQKPLEEHFCHLIVHGFLHLFGYDHQIDEDAAVMERLETAVMRRVGFSDPYAGEAA